MFFLFFVLKFRHIGLFAYFFSCVFVCLFVFICFMALYKNYLQCWIIFHVSLHNHNDLCPRTLTCMEHWQTRLAVAPFPTQFSLLIDGSYQATLSYTYSSCWVR